MEREMKYRRSISFYTLVRSLYGMTDKMYGAVFILHMNFVGLSAVEISSIFAISSLALAVFDYPTGVISDKYGRKKVAGLGYILQGIGAVIFALSKSYFPILGGQTVIALGMALVSGAPMAWIIDIMKGTNTYDKKDSVFPRISSIVQGFGLLGALLSTFLVRFSYSYVLVIVGIVMIFIGFAALFYLEDNKGELEGRGIFQNLVETSKSCLMDKNIKWLLLQGFFTHGGFLVFMLSWQIYLVKILQKDSSYVGMLMTVFMGLIMLGMFITVRLTKTMKNIKISIIAKGVVALGFLLVFMKVNFYFYLAGLVLFEIGYGMNSGASIWFQDYVPNSLRASYSSAYSALISLLGFFLSIFIGILIERFGYRFIWFTAFLFQTASTATLYYISIRKSGVEAATEVS